MLSFAFIFLSVIIMFGAIFLKLNEIEAGYFADNDENQYIGATNLLLGFKASVNILLLGGD